MFVSGRLVYSPEYPFLGHYKSYHRTSFRHGNSQRTVSFVSKIENGGDKIRIICFYNDFMDKQHLFGETVLIKAKASGR